MRSRDALRPAQVAAVQEMVNFEAGILVLTMGSGKSVSALTAFLDLQRADKVDRMLVLAPSLVADTVWPNEPRKWRHLKHLRVESMSGGVARREELLDSTGVDVLTLSHNHIPWLKKHVMKRDTLKRSPSIDFSRTLLVIDEPSKLKGLTSSWAADLLKIAPRFNGRWGLTGTPRPNGVEDLFNPIRIISGDANVWGQPNATEFRREYFRPMGPHEWRIHDFAAPILDRIAQEWCVYADAGNLGKPKLLTGDDFVEHVKLSDEQQRHYDEMFDEMVTQILDGEDGNGWTDRGTDDTFDLLVQAMSRGVASAKLVQIVQGYLYHTETETAHRLKSNPKLHRLMEMDDALGGDTAVITYGLRAEIQDLRERLEARGRAVGLLGGGVSRKKAMETVDAWNRGEVDRLLLHPASAGHGVELQFGGHHMIHYHPTWSAENYDQVIKRLDRPGQTHDVVNWWLMADDTVDEVKYARVERKLSEEEAFRQILKNIVKEF